jgi:phytoene dehydrogenase-like protein
LAEKMLLKINKLIPNFESFIDLKFTATPHTLYRYTLNRNGSFVGWLPSVHQAKKSNLPQQTSVKGLYLTGTWSSVNNPGQGGIPNVASSGKNCAHLILEDF